MALPSTKMDPQPAPGCWTDPMTLHESIYLSFGIGCLTNWGVRYTPFIHPFIHLPVHPPYDPLPNGRLRADSGLYGGCMKGVYERGVWRCMKGVCNRSEGLCPRNGTPGRARAWRGQGTGPPRGGSRPARVCPSRRCRSDRVGRPGVGSPRGAGARNDTQTPQMAKNNI